MVNNGVIIIDACVESKPAQPRTLKVDLKECRRPKQRLEVKVSRAKGRTQKR